MELLAISLVFTFLGILMTILDVYLWRLAEKTHKGQFVHARPPLIFT